MAASPTLTEAAIQKQIVDYVTTCVPSARIFAIPNAAPRKRGARAVNAVPGLTKGVPDLAMIAGRTTYWIEVKSARGKLSPEQREVIAWIGAQGSWAVVVRSLDDMRAALRLWRIKTREVV